MNHFKIVCKWPPRPEPQHSRERYPIVNGRLPDLTDCSFFFVDNKGEEHEILNVDKCIITIDQHEVVRAQMSCIGVELDIEAFAACTPFFSPSKL